jgi:hypothetical protein
VQATHEGDHEKNWGMYHQNRDELIKTIVESPLPEVQPGYGDVDLLLLWRRLKAGKQSVMPFPKLKPSVGTTNRSKTREGY